MAVLLSPVGGAAAQFLDNNGNPLLAGKLYTYVAGTTTNQATYTSSSGVTPHTNPIILDAGGRVPSGEIWLTDGLQYKFVLKNANDVLIGTYDNLVGINSNFVNFLTETEVQTATAGQTVFTLTTMQYQPGTNNLTVYVDGVNQIDGATYSYVETSSTVVTFTAGLHVGALVKFTTAQTLSTGVTDASLVTYDPPFTGSVATTVEDKLAQYVSVKDFGAVGDGVTNDDAAFAAAISYCNANNAELYASPPDVFYKLSASLNITCPFNAGRYQVFSPTSTVTFSPGAVGYLYPEWWGADPTNTNDSLAAWQACTVAAKGNQIIVSGVYKFSDTLTVDYADNYSLKIIGGGAHLLNPTDLATNKFALNFNGIPSGNNALELKGIRSLVLEDFFISHLTGGSGGGVTVKVFGLDTYRITGVHVVSYNGTNSVGWLLGAGSGATTAFMGLIQNCKVYANGGISFYLNSVTSVNLNNCYQIGGKFLILNSIYCELNNCASENSPDFGFLVNACSSIQFNSCAGEANQKSVFYVSGGSTAITLINPFGAGNNVSGAAVADIVQIDGGSGFNDAITIVNPVSVSAGVGTVANILSFGSNKNVDVSGVIAANLALGVTGPDAWLKTYLTLSGEQETRTFTPTLTGWTNVGAPTITAKYLKKGKLVYFTILVIPGTSVSTTLNTSYITLSGFGPTMASSANVVGDNNVNYGNSNIDLNGNIWMQTIGVITAALTITGVFAIN